MDLIRAVFYKKSRITKRGYRTHSNDNGLPLCRISAAQSHGATTIERCEWVAEFGTEPTCPVCARMIKRRNVQQGRSRDNSSVA